MMTVLRSQSWPWSPCMLHTDVPSCVITSSLPMSAPYMLYAKSMEVTLPALVHAEPSYARVKTLLVWLLASQK